MEKLYNALNKQVANLSVFFTKLHHYHWYVKGPEFFTLHEKFEELYDEANELYDEFAERLIIIGGNPVSNLKGYLQITSLKEANESKTSDMITAVVNDYKLMVQELKALVVLSQDLEDEVTADLAIGTLTSFEKNIWMLGALLK